MPIPPMWLLSLVFMPKILFALFTSLMCYWPHIFYLLDFVTLVVTNYEDPHYTTFPTFLLLLSLKYKNSPQHLLFKDVHPSA
jgi:hypothetical protein